MFVKAVFTSGKVNKVDCFTCLADGIPIVLYRGVAFQVQPFLNGITFPWIVNDQWEGAGIYCQFGLLHGCVVGHTMLGLASRVGDDDSWTVVFVGFHHTTVKMVKVGAGSLCHVNVGVHHADVG